ncbi:cytochrome P450 94A1-like [Macadamia integrifolia]|uniref:cytochrome P450 94A1-like n=1 Tax=Macadamia integrifolia TaxID=60698 RepID=UPI001C4F22BD|nr:cytochrome P450 94A1-like [Macadamia integrifolia]
MFQPEFLTSLLLFILPFFFIFLIKTSFSTQIRKNKKSSSVSSSPTTKFPKSYPLLGSSIAISANQEIFNQWATELLKDSPNGNILLHRPLGHLQFVTTDPANIQHILKNEFNLYPKGDFFRDTLTNFLGDGIFNADGDNWRFQRQISSHEFNTKSLRKFTETVVEDEIIDRLLPLLSEAASKNHVIDLQDILQRFAFDNVCKIAFGYDPATLSPSFPQPRSEFAEAFEIATQLNSERFHYIFPPFWKLKRALNIGSEKILREANATVREFATKVVREKRRELQEKSSLETEDLLSRILNSGHSDERFVTDMVISFILAGRDTTSAALIWFFLLVSRNPRVEEELVKELKEKPESLDYNDVKQVVYTHAAICETMRLYPPVPNDTKFAAADNYLPDGTFVKKGAGVTYFPYAMGRMEKLWGKDCMEFRPERWLEKEEENSSPSGGKLKFVGKDPYKYPVFQAGPRVCLGKDMAFLQMQKIVAGVMQKYRVVPAEKEFDPLFVSYMSSKMKGGFPVRIEKRMVASSEQ